MDGPSALRADARRLVIFTVYNRRGEVSPSTAHALQSLRPFAAEIIAVVNGPLNSGQRDVLDALVDDVMMRRNEGFDVGAQRDALASLDARVPDFDEILLTNDTWYGPIDSFTPLFQQMDAAEVDFWGLTAHGDHDGFPRHLQSYWLAIRRRMLEAPEWSSYWADQPVFTTYWDAVLRHEVVFTQHFESKGFISAAAFPEHLFPPGNASILAPDLLLEAGCPVLKRRVFFHDPVSLVRDGGSPRRAAETALAWGFPRDVLLADLARTVAPAVLRASCELVGSAPGVGAHRSEKTPVLAFVSASDARGAAELAARIGSRLGAWDVVLTLDEGAPAGPISAEFDRAKSLVVRVAESPQSTPVADAVQGWGAVDARRDGWVVVLRTPTAATAGARAWRADADVLDALLGHEAAPAFAVDDLRVGAVFATASFAGAPHHMPDGEEVRRLRVAAGVRVPWEDDAVGALVPSGGMLALRPQVLEAVAVAIGSMGSRDSTWSAGVIEAVLAAVAGERGLLTLSVAAPRAARQAEVLGRLALRAAEGASEGVEGGGAGERAPDAGGGRRGRLETVKGALRRVRRWRTSG